jgi:RNA polymerase sigma-70 factor (ECF subfamily)
MGSDLVLEPDAVTSDEERELCRTYEARIRGYGLRHLRDAAAAADLVQQVLLAVLQAVREGKVEQPDRMGAYVLGTCRYTVRDIQRREARQRRVAEETAVIRPEGYEPRWAGVDLRRLENCMMGLEPRDRGVVMATFVYERDADEIGRAFDLSPGNVRVIRHRALARLQACVEGESP